MTESLFTCAVRAAATSEPQKRVRCVRKGVVGRAGVELGNWADEKRSIVLPRVGFSFSTSTLCGGAPLGGQCQRGARQRRGEKPLFSLANALCAKLIMPERERERERE